MAQSIKEANLSPAKPPMEFKGGQARFRPTSLAEWISYELTLTKLVHVNIVFKAE